jgi:hypothetical protein
MKNTFTKKRKMLKKHGGKNNGSFFSNLTEKIGLRKIRNQGPRDYDGFSPTATPESRIETKMLTPEQATAAKIGEQIDSYYERQKIVGPAQAQREAELDAIEAEGPIGGHRRNRSFKYSKIKTIKRKRKRKRTMKHKIKCRC